MSVLNITKENFNKEVLENEKPVLLDFYADWCGPCRMLSPIIKEISAEHPEYTVGKINVDDEPELAEKFGIISIPSVFALKNGTITDNKVGYTSKEELLKMLDI